MRQSLSENQNISYRPPEPTARNWPAAARAVYLAVALSAVLVVVAVIDQTGGRSLADHAAVMYAPYGKRPDPSLLYGLVYTVAAVGALLWLLVLRAVQSRGRSAPILAVVVTTVTGALALILLGTSEYGTQIFPPLWGILAIAPAAAGLLAVVLLRWRDVGGGRGRGRVQLAPDDLARGILGGVPVPLWRLAALDSAEG